MKNRKGIIITIVSLVILAVLGVGIYKVVISRETHETDSKLHSEVSVNTTEDNTEESVESDAEPAPEQTPSATPAPTKAPEKKIVGFDEEFLIRKGGTVYVGGEDISITLDNIYGNLEGTYYCYTLCVGTETYSGRILRQLDGEVIPWQDKFTAQRVLLIDSDGYINNTFVITETTVAKEPLVLSGNADDEYVTTEPEYVETDEYVLFLDEGVKVYGNTIELLKTIFALVEKETGLEMRNDRNHENFSNEIKIQLFGAETFVGVDPDCEKYHIYVVPREKHVALGMYGAIIINPTDLEIAKGEGEVVVHEYTHSVQIANGIWLGSVLDEGYATYITGQITKKDEIINFKFDAEFNYSDYPKVITKDNAEAIFLEEPEDGWENYLYGYRLLNFLHERYGGQVYKEILEDAALNIPQGRNALNREEAAFYIRKHTSDTVFEEFAEWRTANRKRFGD